MCNLADDTTVEPLGDGRYRAELCSDWALIGPNGGYLAAVALRAAAQVTTLPRPASISCQFVRAPRFAPVELDVELLRQTRRTAAIRVTMTQFGWTVLTAQLWATRADLDGPDAAWCPKPEVPPPSELPDLRDLLELEGRGVPPWHDCVTLRELAGRTTLETPRPVAFSWGRFQPQATFADSWLDACRSVVLIDSLQWPAVMNAFPELETTLFAPSIDLYAGFHDSALDDEWLLVDATGLASRAGVFGGRAQVWAPDGRLIASGMQQMLSTATRRNASLAPVARPQAGAAG